MKRFLGWLDNMTLDGLLVCGAVLAMLAILAYRVFCGGCVF